MWHGYKSTEGMIVWNTFHICESAKGAIIWDTPMPAPKADTLASLLHEAEKPSRLIFTTVL